MEDAIAARNAGAPLTFAWDERRERAAAHLARGELSVEEIAGDCGVDRDTIWRWRKSPIFRARVTLHLSTYRDELLKIGVADKAERVSALQDRHARLQRVIEERAEAAASDPEARATPGALSGLMVRQVRVTGSGRSAERVDEWVVDTALLREMRSIEEHISRELGQWSPSVAVAVQITKLYGNIDIDRV